MQAWRKDRKRIARRWRNASECLSRHATLRFILGWVCICWLTARSLFNWSQSMSHPLLLEGGSTPSHEWRHLLVCYNFTRTSSSCFLLSSSFFRAFSSFSLYSQFLQVQPFSEESPPWDVEGTCWLETVVFSVPAVYALTLSSASASPWDPANILNSLNLSIWTQKKPLSTKSRVKSDLWSVLIYGQSS